VSANAGGAPRDAEPTVVPLARGDGPPEPHERRLVSYLLVPRPQDLVKALIAPTTYIVAAAAGGSFDRWARFVSLWLILEFLIYHARYQLNDVRGIADDSQHPERRLRGRLPLGATVADSRRNAKVSLTVAGARLLAAVLIGAALASLKTVMVLILSVLSIAIVYEALRSQRPERVRAAAGRREFGVWIVVGLGYAVRAGLGLALAGFGSDGVAMGVGVAFFSAVGTTYVLLNWALEASNFSTYVGGRWVVSEGLRGKPHISTLLPYLDGSRGGGPAFRTTPQQMSRQASGYLGASKVLHARGGLCSPWNIALSVGSVLAGPLTIVLAAVGPAWASATVIAVCVGGAAGLYRAGRSAVRWGIVATVSVALETVTLAAHAPSAWVAAFPWLVLSGCYAGLRSMSYLDSMGLPALVEVRRPGQS
jgi:hypothetical protein